MASVAPTLAWERELAADGYALVAGCDEVGRGALAGPVSVGVVVIRAADAVELAGVKDSKLLREPVRRALVPAIQEWAAAHAVGHATAAEIDALGLVAALRLAGTRALAGVAAELTPGFLILDGNQDWLSEPAQPELALPELALPELALDGGLFEGGLSGGGRLGSGRFDAGLPGPGAGVPPSSLTVRTRIKADMTCLSVAAASVLAKVERDGIMTALAADFPQFGWDGNKGYATAAHRAAIAAHGPSDFHRKSWRLT